MKGLKISRIALAILMFCGITSLLLCPILMPLEETGALRSWLGWMPKVQLLPAILALNVAVVVAILLVTFLIGRCYCSVVCPMGILQDFFTWIGGAFLKKRFRYRKPLNWLRYTVLGLFVALMLLGLNGIAIMITPYSAFSRMTVGFFSTGTPLIVAIVTLIVIFTLSFLYGRIWCNTICPVGSLLGIISRYSIFGVKIDSSKCVACHKCENGCKTMSIDIDGGKRVDSSRCVNCMNCIATCKVGAISLGKRTGNGVTSDKPVDTDRRRFIATTAAVGAAMALEAQEQKMDGGLAVIAKKTVPEKKNAPKPFGSKSLKNFNTRCTGCQLCVSQCPEKVLRPSTKLDSFMQPEMVYTAGYCRLNCTRCGDVCPSGAIQPVTKEEKTSISIGFAVTLHENCLSAQGVNCGTCARHCPAGAIIMVDDPATGHKVPSVNENRCIGCGACEHYCPARPMTAIYVEGREVHASI